MKKKKDYGIYDFSDYAEEITGEDLLKINGGANTGCNGGGPKPNPAPTPDPVTPKPKPTTPTNPTPTTTTNTPQSGNNGTKPENPNSEYAGVPPQYWTVLDEQQEKRIQEEFEKNKSPVKKAYGKINPKDIKGKFVFCSVSKSKGIMDVYVSRSDDTKVVDKTVTFNVVTNVQSDSIDNKKPADTDRYQGNGTNPTQVENGIYEITEARAPSTGNGKYGEKNQGLVVNVKQELLISDPNNQSFGKNEYTKDEGYMIHITPYNYTNGCVGFKYELNNNSSKNYALSQQMYLVSLFENSKQNNQKVYIEYKD